MPSVLTPTETKTICLVGSGGLLAGEFLRLIQTHPGLSLGAAVSRTGGKSLAALHPHLSTEETTLALDEVEVAVREHDVLVLALPHGLTAGLVERLGSELDDKVVLDLSADHRLKNAGDFVYGLVELDRERIAASKKIAVPGCFATALQLACVPAATAGMVSGSETWMLSAVTGSSGSGAEPKPGTHHPHRHGNLWAYALEGHRHEPELLQALEPLGMQPPLCFLPHSGPFVRGIHLTALLPISARVSAANARQVYREFYAGEPFVEILDQAPDLRRVVGSNRVSIHVAVRGDKLVCLLTLDNVIKGGAGQALQCLNLVLGWPEQTALPSAGLGVV